MVRPIEWIADDTIRCRDIRLKMSSDGVASPLPEGDEQVAIYKTRAMMEAQARVLQSTDVRRMLELGMWQGGSAIFLEHHFELERLAAVDIQTTIPFLERYVERHHLGERIRVHCNTSQDDEVALEKLLREDFAGAELDAVVDDASHLLQQTRRSFEICFPYLRSGGLYIIEDWRWGHVDATGCPKGTTELQLSPLVLELLLVSASCRDIIRHIHVNKWFVAVERGEASLERKPLKLDSLYYPGGLSLPWGRRERVRRLLRRMLQIADRAR
jgi:hypothetical protein